MNASGKFFKFSFVSNLLLGIVGFLIFWLCLHLSDYSVAPYIICGIIFFLIAFAYNVFIVKTAKLKKFYVLFGFITNIIIVAGLTVLISVLNL